MSNEGRARELLGRWEDLRESGTPMSPAEICRDTPELEGPLEDLIRAFYPGELADPAPADEALGPPRAGRYRIKRLVGRGGFADVFLAYDEELRRDVALKRLQRTRAWDRDGRARFLREAELTGRLQHPGVVPVHGLVEDPEGNPCYAMRFVERATLEAEIDRFHSDHAAGVGPGERARALQKLLRTFLAVCEAVAYAHSRGVVHRDLKPANILLGDYGEVYVGDWGLAKSTGPGADGEPPRPATSSTTTAGKTSIVCVATTSAPRSSPPHDRAMEPDVTPTDETFASPVRATVEGQMKGTPAYMSPEQAAGEGHRVGPAADIYGLGATLYKLLTGAPPVGGETLGEVRSKVLRGAFARPREVVPSVPPALEAVCLKAMHLDPARRYAGALELAGDVERWLADEPVGAWAEPWPTRARRWVQAHRTWVAGAAAALLVATAASAVVSVQAYRGAERTRRKNAELRKVYRGLGAFALGDVKTLGAGMVVIPRDVGDAALSGLEGARDGLRALAREDPSDPEVQADLAGFCGLLAVVREQRGETAAALEAVAESRRTYERLAAHRSQGARARSGLALAHLTEGRVRLRAGGYRPTDPLVPGNTDRTSSLAALAEPAFARARQTLDGLLKDEPENLDYQVALASATWWLGLTIAMQSRDAIPTLEKARAIAAALAEKHAGLDGVQEGRETVDLTLCWEYLRLAERTKASRPGDAYAAVQKAHSLLGPYARRQPPPPGFRECYQAHLGLWGALLEDRMTSLVNRPLPLGPKPDLFPMLEDALPAWEEWAVVVERPDREVIDRLNWLRMSLGDTALGHAASLDPSRPGYRAEAERALRLGLAALDRLPPGPPYAADIARVAPNLRAILDLIGGAR